MPNIIVHQLQVSMCGTHWLWSSLTLWTIFIKLNIFIEHITIPQLCLIMFLPFYQGAENNQKTVFGDRLSLLFWMPQLCQYSF